MVIIRRYNYYTVSLTIQFYIMESIVYIYFTNVWYTLHVQWRHYAFVNHLVNTLYDIWLPDQIPLFSSLSSISEMVVDTVMPLVWCWSLPTSPNNPCQTASLQSELSCLIWNTVSRPTWGWFLPRAWWWYSVVWYRGLPRAFTMWSKQWHNRSHKYTHMT
jgi:hypothetical protein